MQVVAVSLTSPSASTHVATHAVPVTFILLLLPQVHFFVELSYELSAPAHKSQAPVAGLSFLVATLCASHTHAVFALAVASSVGA